MSKALMEKNVIARSKELNKGDTILCLTRYGNVMGSRGSVIQRFLEQIHKGEDLTITNPQMTRFMMTLDEACDLVLYAFANGEQGDLFVQKAPACSLDTLSKAILKLNKSKLGVKIIGVRHGEKTFETLVTHEEMARAIDNQKFYRIPCDGRNLNYENYFEKGNKKFVDFEDYTSNNTHQLSVDETIELLKKMGNIE